MIAGKDDFTFFVLAVGGCTVLGRSLPVRSMSVQARDACRRALGAGRGLLSGIEHKIRNFKVRYLFFGE